MSEAVKLATRVAAALGVAHARGACTATSKPSNLFLPGGRIEQVKVLDFGMRAARGQHAADADGVLLGTPAYMAPEQARSQREIDARVDVYALGCVLYECLTGSAAVRGQHRAWRMLGQVLFGEVPR